MKRGTESRKAPYAKEFVGYSAEPHSPCLPVIILGNLGVFTRLKRWLSQLCMFVAVETCSVQT